MPLPPTGKELIRAIVRRRVRHYALPRLAERSGVVAEHLRRFADGDDLSPVELHILGRTLGIDPSDEVIPIGRGVQG